MKKIYFVFAGAFVALVVGFLIWQFAGPKQPANEQELIGGQTDEHGCLVAAGYSWCEAKQKCLRVWEEPCEQETNNNTTTDELNKNNMPANNIIKNENGFIVEVLKEGAGQEAKNNDTIAVHYVGTFEDGAKFDSSIDRGEAFVFVLGEGRVIKGWDLGVLGMKIGEKRKLTVPGDLAYGSVGRPGAIPPNATLIFEVELLAIK